MDEAAKLQLLQYEVVMAGLSIFLPESSQHLLVSEEVLQTFTEARQINPGDYETGGVLLAQISKDEVNILKATRAEERASISRILFKPSLRRKRKIVENAFKKGLHFVGEWHTHPEQDPSPSLIDIHSMDDAFQRSTHKLNSFLMIIVGNRINELSLSFTLHSTSKIESLGQYRIEL